MTTLARRRAQHLEKTARLVRHLHQRGQHDKAAALVAALDVAGTEFVPLGLTRQRDALVKELGRIGDEAVSDGQ